MRTSVVKRDLEKGQLSFAFCGLIDIDAGYYGRGNYGMVADNHDGTVTKLFFREDALHDNDHRIQMYQNEISALKLLSGTALSTHQVPALVNDYGLVDHDRILAAYRMTKLNGRVIPKTEFDHLTQNQKDKFYHDIGTMIADFHTQATAQIGAGIKGIEITVSECEITFISQLDPHRTRALLIANKFYKQNQTPTIQHGDLHLGNIIINDDEDHMGFIDFGTLGAVSDRLLDIVTAGNNCNDSTTPDKHTKILAAYNDRRGTYIDETSLLLSRLATATGRLKYAWYDTARRREEIEAIDQILPRLADAGIIPRPR